MEGGKEGRRGGLTPDLMEGGKEGSEGGNGKAGKVMKKEN